MDKVKLQPYILRLVFLLFGLSASMPLTAVITFICDIPFSWLMPSLYAAIIIILLFDFRKRAKAVFYSFVLRLLLALIIGFGIFYQSPLLPQIIISVYTLSLISFLAYVISDKYYNVGVFCFVMFMFNLIMSIMIGRPVLTEEQGQFINTLIVISTVATLAYYLVLNMDSARWFGPDRLNIPDSMKRSSILILTVVSVIIAIVSLSSLILQAVEALFSNIYRLISGLLNLIPLGGAISDEQPVVDQGGGGFPSFEEELVMSEVTEVNPVIIWIILGIFVLVMASLLVYAFIKLIKLALMLFKTGRGSVMQSSEVFTEIIEKIAPARKKRTIRDFIREPRYSSLQTDRERILFIYRAYVKRAKRHGYTYNSNSGTANEILDEITQNASPGTFPLPENLNAAFNAVRYSNEVTVPLNADELKRKLL